MKTRTILCGLGLCCGLGMVEAQQVRLAGQLLFRSDSTAVVGATILTTSGGGQAVTQGVTGEKGYFGLKVDGTKISKLTFTFVGARPLTIELGELKEDLDLGQLYLDDESNKLGEVAVQATSQTVDKRILFPKAKQRQSSRTVFDLLRSFNLSGLRIDLATNAASIDDKGVRWLINGVPVTAAQVRLINPNLIKRVEYSDMPSMREVSQGLGGAINIYVQRPERGGLLGLTLKSALWTGLMDGGVYAKHSEGKSDWELEYEASYRDYNKWKQDRTETYRATGREVRRSSTGLDSWMMYLNQSFTLRYVYQPSEQKQLSVAWRNSINRDEREIRSLITEEGNASYHRSTRPSIRAYTPALDVYYQQSMRSGAKLEANIIGSLSQSDNTRLLTDSRGQESLRSLSTPSESRFRSLFGELDYRHPLSKSTSLDLGGSATLAAARNSYGELLDQVDKLHSATSHVWAQLSGRLAAKWQYGLGLGYQFKRNSNETESRSYHAMEGSARLFYSPISSLNFSLWGYATPSHPSLGSLSAVTQEYDNLISYAGNPQLRSYYAYTSGFKADYRQGKFGLSLRLSGNYSPSGVYTSLGYSEQLKRWIFQGRNSDYLSQTKLELNPMLENIGNVLSLYGLVGYVRYNNSLEGMRSQMSDLYTAFTATAVYKAWTLTASYARNPSSFSGYTRSDYDDYLGLYLVWTRGPLRLYANMNYLASRYGDYYHSQAVTPYYTEDRTTTIANNRNMLTLGFSWYMMYGKQQQRNQRPKSRKIDTRTLVQVNDGN